MLLDGSSLTPLSFPAIVGLTGLESYRQCTGYRWTGPPRRRELGPQYLEDLVVRLKEFVGAEQFEALAAQDARRVALGASSSHRGRLMVLVSEATLAAKLLRWAAQTEIALAPLLELNTAVSLLERWRHHPEWERIRQGLISEFEHTINHLVVASYLVDAGNGVGIGRPQGAGVKVPDVWIQTDALLRVELEVKAPLRLRGGASLTPPEARQLVERYIKKTVSGKTGQLSGRDGVLAIGGFALRADDLDALATAAHEILEGRSHRHPHLVAILVTTIGLIVDGASASSGMEHRLVPHPGYRGTASLNVEHPGEDARPLGQQIL